MENLIQLRKLHKKTQKNMAILLGISQQAYATYENGTRIPPIDILIKLANYFDVTIDYIVGRTTTSTNNNNINTLIQKYNLLDERKKNMVEAYIDAMLDISAKENKTVKNCFNNTNINNSNIKF